MSTQTDMTGALTNLETYLSGLASARSTYKTAYAAAIAAAPASSDAPIGGVGASSLGTKNAELLVARIGDANRIDELIVGRLRALGLADLLKQARNAHEVSSFAAQTAAIEANV
jgi:hypothetical protein